MLARFQAHVFVETQDLVEYYVNTISTEKTIILTEKIFQHLVPVLKQESQFIIMSEVAQNEPSPENIKYVKTVLGSLIESAKHTKEIEVISDENDITNFFQFSYLCDAYFIHENHNQQENKLQLSFLNENCPNSKIVENTATKKIIKFKYKKLHPEQNYLNLLEKIMNSGNEQIVFSIKTLSLFAEHLEFDISKSVPIFTTKKVFFDKCVAELLWMITGKTWVGDLHDVNVHFWDYNCNRKFLDQIGLTHVEEGDMGPVYGFQWRHWGAEYTNCHADYTGKGLDQLAQLIDAIKKREKLRKLVLSCWNFGDLSKMCMAPCLPMMQFYIRNNEFLDVHLYQRGADMFLGAPYDILQTSILCYMIAHLSNLSPGKLSVSYGDSHIYLAHVEHVKVQLARTPRPFPTLSFRRNDIQTIDDFVLEDFVLSNYSCCPYISCPLVTLPGSDVSLDFAKKKSIN